MECTLLRWSAWAPGLEHSGDWQAWAEGRKALLDDGSSPRLEEVKPMLRRRFSRLTRMALHAAFQCLEGRHQLRTVFCSRHGEIHRTKALLEELAREEPISPMGFSLSVHNTASGLYSIASGNTAPSTAIAAGAETLEMALVEVMGLIHRNPADPVLLVIADEPLPEFYRRFDDDSSAPYAFAMLLGAAGQEGVALSLQALAETGHSELPHGLALLRWLHSSGADCVLGGERLSWRWSRQHG